MEVRARLSAETAQFQKGLDNATRSVSQFARSSQGLQTALTGIGIAAAGVTTALIGFGVKAFNAAARVDELDVALQAVGASTGKGYDALRDAAVAVKGMGIEMEVAQKSVLKYAQNNLDLGKASEVARVAQDLAVIGAMNSTEAFDRLTHGIITGRSEVLKSVGIQKSAGQAYAEYAATIGKTAKQLSYSEKQTAIMNMVLKEGARVAGTYEAAMTTPGKVLRSFARITNDLQVAVGGVLLKGFGPMIFQGYELYKTISKAAAGSGAFGQTLQALQKVVVKLTQPVTKFLEKMKGVIENMDKASVNVDSLGRTIEFLLPPLAALAAGFSAFAGARVFAMVPVLGSILKFAKPLPVAFIAMALTSTQVRDAFGKLLRALQPLAAPLTQLGKIFSTVLAYAVAIFARAISGIAAIVQKVTTFFKEHERVARIIGQVFVALAVAIGIATIAMYANFAASKVMGLGNAIAGVATALLRGQQLSTIASTNTLAASMLRLNAIMAANPIIRIVLLITALVAAFVIAWKNSEKFRTAVTNAINSIARVVGKGLSFVIKTIGQMLLAFGYAIDIHNDFGKVVSEVIQFVFEAFLNYYIMVLKGIKFLVDGFISLMTTNDAFAQVVEAVINFVIKAFLNYYKFVLGGIRNIIMTFIDLMENHQVFREVVETVFNSVIRTVSLFVTTFINIVANILKGVATVIYVFEKLLEGVKAVSKLILGAFALLGSGAAVIFREIGGVLGEFLKSAATKVKDWIMSIVALVKNIPFLGQIVSALMRGVDSVTEATISGLKNVGSAIKDTFSVTSDQTGKQIDYISKLSEVVAINSKSWGNYSSGVSGALSTVANKLSDFSLKVTKITSDNLAEKTIDALVSGAKKVVPVLDKVLAGIDSALQVNYGKAVVDTLVKGAEFASAGLGKMITELEKLKDLKVGEFVVKTTSEAAVKAGNFLISLAAGIESFTENNFVEKLGDAFGDMIDGLKTGLGFGDIMEEERKAIQATLGKTGADDQAAEDLLKQADLMKQIREAMRNGLENMKSVLDDLKQASKDFADSLKDTILSFAGLKSVELPDGFIPKAKSLIENMKMRLDKTQQFAQQISQLRVMGLDYGALKAIIEEGPIKGAQLAASILGGGLEAVKQVSELQKQIEFAGAVIGVEGSEVAFGPQIARAEQLYAETANAAMSIRSAGSQIFIEQGAFVVNVDTAGAADAEERADIITRRIQETFAVLAKELAAK
jgi:phage-related protein